MNENSKIRKQIIVRLSLVYIGVFIFASTIVGKVLYLQIIQHEKWVNANETSQKKTVIEPDRGDILSQDGRVLATSVPYYEVRMDTKCPSKKDFYAEIDSLSFLLSNLFKDKTAAQYKRMLMGGRYKGDRYLLIKRKVDYIELKQLKTFPLFRRGQYKGGIIINQENRRIQPFVNLASRTIGYENRGGAAVGIEGAFHKYLKGEQGVRMEQKIAGNYWMPISDENEVEPKNGKDVVTTIDINLQDVAFQALKEQLKKHTASHGTAILMEVQTGDIKAIANLKNKDGFYSEQYNFAIGERTEPGSTFKLASFMVAMEDGYINLEDSVNTEKGVVKYYDHKITDSKRGGHGKITVQQAFELSSNVAVSKIITKFYTGKEERFVNRLKRMSLTEKLGIEIKGERRPYIKFPGDTLWSGISLAQMSYGYEIEQTPLQILAFYNAVANNGKMMKPRFVKAIADYGKIVKTFKPQVINPTICSKATILKAKKMLEGVVENGTAQNLKNSNYKIAGKTGTAQIANQKYGYKYQSKISYQASFVGYFPADNPKYSCIVVVNAPSSGVYYGNLVAGQVFKEIADKVYSTSIDLQENNFSNTQLVKDVPYSKNGNRKELLQVLKDLRLNFDSKNIRSDWVLTQKQDTSIKLYNRYIKKNSIPNVKGMGAKDAIFLLENMGLNVVLKGRGTVEQQSLSPNSLFRKGDKIVLTLT